MTGLGFLHVHRAVSTTAKIEPEDVQDSLVYRCLHLPILTHLIVAIVRPTWAVLSDLTNVISAMKASCTQRTLCGTKRNTSRSRQPRTRSTAKSVVATISRDSPVATTFCGTSESSIRLWLRPRKHPDFGADPSRVLRTLFPPTVRCTPLDQSVQHSSCIPYCCLALRRTTTPLTLRGGHMFLMIPPQNRIHLVMASFSFRTFHFA